MTRTTRMGRITGPVAYLAQGGKQLNIPLGPCMVERGEGERVDIIWGATGQNSTALPLLALQTAESSGHLVLLG